MKYATFYYINKNGEIEGKKMPVNEFKKLLSEGNSNKFSFSTLPKKKKKKKSKSETDIHIKPVKDRLCKKKARLSSSAKEELTKLVHTAGTKGKRGKFNHHEVGGLLKLKPSGSEYTVEVNKSSYMTGDKDGTNVPEGQAGFHTHPAGEYIRQQVSYAWPSGDDYMAILEKMIKEDCVLHVVATKEGIYGVSFSEQLAKTDKDTLKKLLKEKATMVYKVGLPGKNGETPQDYLRKINSFKNPIFTVEFRSWKSKKPFTFVFPLQKGGDCKL